MSEVYRWSRIQNYDTFLQVLGTPGVIIAQAEAMLDARCNISNLESFDKAIRGGISMVVRVIDPKSFRVYDAEMYGESYYIWNSVLGITGDKDSRRVPRPVVCSCLATDQEEFSEQHFDLSQLQGFYLLEYLHEEKVFKPILSAEDIPVGGCIVDRSNHKYYVCEFPKGMYHVFKEEFNQASVVHFNRDFNFISANFHVLEPTSRWCPVRGDVTKDRELRVALEHLKGTPVVQK